MVGSTLAVVASRDDSTVPTLSQPRPHQPGTIDRSHRNQKIPKDVEGAGFEEEKARIERLGRERPANFKSIWSEAAFCYSIVASMIMAVGGIISWLLRHDANILA